MSFLLRTQLQGIGRSKRLLGTLLIAPALLLFCSYNAANSWMPAQMILAMFAALTAMLSSEVLHWLVIDEIKDGLFDIFLISPISRIKILLCKLAVPTAVGILFSIASLLLNNFLAYYDHFTVWIFSLSSCFFLVFAAIFSALSEFISLLIARRNNTNIHFLLLAGSIFLMLWLYSLIESSLAIFYASAVLLLLIVGAVSFLLLKLRYQITAGGSGYTFPHLFGDSKIGLFGAFFRKNISIIRFGKHTWVQFLISFLSPLLLCAAASTQTSIPVNRVLLLLFSPIVAVTHIYFVFYSSLYENRNHIKEILQIRGISSRKIIMEKAATSGIYSSVLCTVSFLIIYSFVRCSMILLPITIINAFLSALLCSVYSCNICSFKAENIHKVAISFISLLLPCLALVLL